jgi:hypothetical protein
MQHASIDWDAGGVYVDWASNTLWDDALLDAERCSSGMASLERAHWRQGSLAYAKLKLQSGRIEFSRFDRLRLGQQHPCICPPMA